MSGTDPELIIPLNGGSSHPNGSSVSTQIEEARAEHEDPPNSLPKFSPLEEELAPVHSNRRNLLAVTAGRWMQDRYPRTSRLFGRVLKYIKGLQPPVISPRKSYISRGYGAVSDFVLAPLGWLDRTWRFKGRSLDIHWERYVLRYTHPFRRPWIFWPLAAAYIISLAFFARANYFLTPASSFVGCTATYWLALDGCGLNGSSCEPFNNVQFNFRCPAGCKETILLNPRTVGNEEVDYVPLVVGGGDSNRTYRGDSFLCAAGIHASVTLHRETIFD
jgi:hypothetical protein